MTTCPKGQVYNVRVQQHPTVERIAGVAKTTGDALADIFEQCERPDLAAAAQKGLTVAAAVISAVASVHVVYRAMFRRTTTTTATTVATTTPKPRGTTRQQEE